MESYPVRFGSPSPFYLYLFQFDANVLLLFKIGGGRHTGFLCTSSGDLGFPSLYPGRLLGGTIKDSHTGGFSLKVVQNFSNILMSWVGLYEKFGVLESQDTKISDYLGLVII